MIKLMIVSLIFTGIVMTMQFEFEVESHGPYYIVGILAGLILGEID